MRGNRSCVVHLLAMSRTLIWAADRAHDWQKPNERPSNAPAAAGAKVRRAVGLSG
jgi:hypothetical protein